MIKKLFNTYYKNDEGVALLEGILITPIAILMFIGIFEVGQMLLLNQKIYAASHMAGDLLTRKPALDNDDLDEAYAAGQLMMEPFNANNLKFDVVGVRFNGSDAPEQVWQETYGGDAAVADLYLAAEGLGTANEGAIVVSARYQYNPIFSGLRLPFIGNGDPFVTIDMKEVSVLRGRINSCQNYQDGGTLYTC